MRGREEDCNCCNNSVVKMIKQNLSITIAANFQSDSISFSSSIAFSLFVMNLISFSIVFSSLLVVQLLLRLGWLVLTWFMSELGLELFSGWNPFSLMKPPPDDKALKQLRKHYKYQKCKLKFKTKLYFSTHYLTAGCHNKE